MVNTGFPGEAPPPSESGAAAPEAAEATMPPEEATLWKARITACREFIRPVIELGKKNVLRQKQKFFNQQSSIDRVAAPDDYFLSQQKISKLFFRVPEPQLSAKRPEFEQAAPKFQAVLNEQLGPEHINLKATNDEMLTDLVTAVGFGACKIGYTATIVDVTKTDSMTNAPMLGPDGVTPITEKALIHEAYEVPRIPPGRMLFPPEFIGSDFDTGPYIGFTLIEDVLPGTLYARTSQVTEFDDLLSQPPAESGNTARTYLLVDAIWFKGSLFKENVQNPEEIWEFEWVRDAPAPRKYRKCPYEKFPGFPVKVLTTCYLSDTALPPSATTITRNLIDAKSIGLSTELIHRQRALPQNAYDSSRIDGETAQKLEANVQDAFIGIGQPVTDDLFKPIVKGQLPQEHYALQEQLNRMIAASWSIGSAQAGAKEQGSHTATEINSIDVAMATRLQYEQEKIKAFFILQCRCVAALIQQYAPANGGYVRTLGQSGAMELMQWTPEMIRGDFAFSIKVNSQLSPDSAADLKNIDDWINFSAKSPNVNQKRNWTLAAEARGFDPFGGPVPLIVDPPPPQAPPAELAALKVEDLFLALTNPIVLETLINYRVPFPKEVQQILAALKASQAAGAPPHNPLTPGAAPEADVLTKHRDSGELPGGGSMVANQVRGTAPPLIPQQLDKSRLM